MYYALASRPYIGMRECGTFGLSSAILRLSTKTIPGVLRLLLKRRPQATHVLIHLRAPQSSCDSHSFQSGQSPADVRVGMSQRPAADVLAAEGAVICDEGGHFSSC